jgi:hypothetical protein
VDGQPVSAICRLLGNVGGQNALRYRIGELAFRHDLTGTAIRRRDFVFRAVSPGKLG